MVLLLFSCPGSPRMSLNSYKLSKFLKFNVFISFLIMQMSLPIAHHYELMTIDQRLLIDLRLSRLSVFIEANEPCRARSTRLRPTSQCFH